MTLLGFAGILIALAVLIYLNCVKRMHAFISVLISVLILIISNKLPLWDTLTDVYIGAIGGWMKDFLFLFTFGSVLGACLQHTGCAQAMGEALIRKLGMRFTGLIIHFLSLILVYAGIDCFVGIMSIAPVSIAMVRKADLPRRFAVACFLAGGCSYAFMLPGSSAVNNLMPMQWLGTNATAAWLPGLAGSLLTAVLVLFYQTLLEKKLRKKCQRFDLDDLYANENFGYRNSSSLPNPWIGFAALAIVILCSVLLGWTGILPSMLAISIGMVSASVLVMIFAGKNLDSGWKSVLEKGIVGGINCTILTGVMLGFVSVIQITDAFQAFTKWVCSIEMPPLLSVVFSMLMINIVMANSPGSITLFMNNLSGQILSMGVSSAVLHRVVTMTSTSMTTMMPHNPGALILTGTYKSSYGEHIKDILIICLISPLAGTLLTILIAGMA